jgi:hypothetical protein
MKGCDPSGNLCTSGGAAKKAASHDTLVGLDRNKGSKNKNENIQLGSLRKNPGGRFQANETAGVKGK